MSFHAQVGHSVRVLCAAPATSGLTERFAHTVTGSLWKEYSVRELNSVPGGVAIRLGYTVFSVSAVCGYPSKVE